MKKNHYFLLLLTVLSFTLLTGFRGAESDVYVPHKMQPVGQCVLFDGMNVGNDLQMWSWGASKIDLDLGTGTTPRKNSLKWIQGDEWGSGWTGIGFTASPVFNLATKWQTDSCKVTLKCEEGIDSLRIQFEGAGGKIGTVFKPISDNQYHTYSFPLREMVPQDNTTGFDSSQVNVVGMMSQANAKAGKAIYITDWWVGNPVLAFPSIVFNGIKNPSTLEVFTWGQSAATIETGAGVVPNSNAIKWVQGNEWGNGWTGFGYNISAPFDLGGAWQVDSVTFKLKCDEGVGALRIQYEDGKGKKGYTFTPTADKQWHTYAFPLSSFIFEDNTNTFDSTNVTVVQLMAEATAVAGKVIYITDWWTGHPYFDVIPPLAATGVSAFAGTFKNVVTWTDVPGETSETYDVYYSDKPITDITTAEVAKIGVGETTQLWEHMLFAPATNQSVTYYYAVVCKDAAGNASVVSASSPAVTNTAKGVPSVSLTVPKNFAADGQLADWAGIAPIIMKPSDGSGSIVTNTKISGDDDCSAKAYLAIDKNYLYVAFDITDDIVSFNPAKTTYLNDSPDLFIGLYNAHGAPHTALLRGAQPDYHFRFAKDRLLLDGSADSILIPGVNYYWGEKFPTGYVVEAKISLANLAAKAKDSLFVPVEGMRLPLDYAINDADATGEREGILTYSPYNEDQSWSTVTRWLYNWIGAKWNPVTDVKDDNITVSKYDLGQNYPNPFNPSTVIKYSVEKAGMVTLKVYDLLGREIATLVNEAKQPGSYTINFNASNLASGMYLYKIETDSYRAVKKMLLVR